jgi:hypothetical protein
MFCTKGHIRNISFLKTEYYTEKVKYLRLQNETVAACGVLELERDRVNMECEPNLRLLDYK